MGYWLPIYGLDTHQLKAGGFESGTKVRTRVEEP